MDFPSKNSSSWGGLRAVEPTLGEPVLALDRLHHPVDDLAAQLVAQVGRVHRIGVVAQAVHRQTVADQRVVGMGERGGVGLERGVEQPDDQGENEGAARPLNRKLVNRPSEKVWWLPSAQMPSVSISVYIEMR